MPKGISKAPGTVMTRYFTPAFSSSDLHPASNAPTIASFHSVRTITTQAPSIPEMPVVDNKLLLLTSAIVVLLDHTQSCQVFVDICTPLRSRILVFDQL